MEMIMAMFYQIDLSLSKLEESRTLQRDLHELLSRGENELWTKYGEPRVYELFENAPVVRDGLLKNDLCSEEFLDHLRSATLGHPTLDFEHKNKDGAHSGSACFHQYCALRGDQQYLYFFKHGVPVKRPPQLREEDLIPKSQNSQYDQSPFTKLLHRVDVSRHGSPIQWRNMSTEKWEDTVYGSGFQESFEAWRKDTVRWMHYPKMMTFLYLWLINPLGLLGRHITSLWLYKVWYRIFPGAHPLRKIFNFKSS